MEMRLVIIEGPGKGTQIPLLKGEYPAGREPECPVYLPSRRVSRKHAVFHCDGERCVVQDLGSANGMLVNGHKMDACELVDGTQLQFGDVLLVFQARASDAPLQVSPTEEHTFEQPPPAFGGDQPPPPFGSDAAPFGGPAAPFGEPPVEPTITRDLPKSLDPTVPPVAPSGTPAPTHAATPAPMPTQPASDPFSSVPWLVRVGALLTVCGLVLMCGPVGGFAWVLAGADSIVEDMADTQGVLLCEGLGHRNSAAIARNDQLALDVQFVLDEPGVKEAFLLDSHGDVIAPPNKTTMSFRRDELFLGAQSARAPVVHTEDGLARIATPIRGAATPGGPAHGSIVGYAILGYDSDAVASDQASFVLRGVASLLWLALAAVVAFAGVWFLGARPLKLLRDETEIAMKTGGRVLPPAAWPEAAALVHSINRVLARSGGPIDEPDDGVTDALLAASTFPVFVLDEGGDVLQANDWGGHLAGSPAAELVGRPFVVLFADAGASDRLRAMISGLETAPVLADRFEVGGSERQVTVARTAAVPRRVVVILL